MQQFLIQVVLFSCFASALANAGANEAPCADKGECKNAEPSLQQHALAVGLALLIGALAAAAGIGGGGLLVPLYSVVLGYAVTDASVLSQITILGGSILNTVLTRAYANVDVFALLSPPLVAGSSVGVLLNRVLPRWATSAILFTVLGYSALRTIKRAKKMWIEESEGKGQASLLLGKGASAPFAGKRIRSYPSAGASRSQSPLLKDQTKSPSHTIQYGIDNVADETGESIGEDENSNLFTDSENEDAPEYEPQRASPTEIFGDEDFAAPIEPTIDQPEHNIPSTITNDSDPSGFTEIDLEDLIEKIDDAGIVRFRRKVRAAVVFAISWIIAVVAALLKGGRHHPSMIGITCGSPPFWVLTTAPLPVLLLLANWVGKALARETHRRALAARDDDELNWSRRRIMTLPYTALLAGTLAGLLGIGGGMVFAPVLLELGVSAQAAAATSALAVLATSSSSSVQFAVLGAIRSPAAPYYALVGFASAGIGQLTTQYVVKRFGRRSVIVFALAIILGLAAAIAVYSIVKEVQQEGMQGLQPLCPSAIPA